MSIIEGALDKATRQGQLLEKKQDAVDGAKKNEAQTVIDKIISPVTTESQEVQDAVSDTPAEQLNWDQLAELGFITGNDTYNKTVEEFRNIKLPLVANAFGAGSEGIKRSNLILITSSVPSEGKTYTAINLAFSIANERDKKVLLIDADVARPSIAKTLGIDEKLPGLIEYLEGQNVRFSDIVRRTNMPGLRIITAGKWHRHSTELLASNRMAMLAEELSNRYPDRIVIFDSPPLLAATQGDVLAKLVGQIVLVIEAEKTPQNIVMESVEKLSECDVVLAVFNKAQRMSDGYYKYGYGYGHYQHSASQEDKKAS